MEKKYTNSLIKETSPYLLQHAHNPVNWMPWGKEALDEAKRENKLLLISIGYSACHWCHVMEHESFEDEEVAEIMNRHFVCIKVDREERPDVDQVYMTAVQLITQSGGWPLNAIALPDGRPIWGGTYFEKRSWINALSQVHAFWKENPEKTEEYAISLSAGIQKSSLLPVSSPTDTLPPELIENTVTIWKSYFDYQWGGRKGAPKFMMPNNLSFLLRWAHQHDDKEVEMFVKTSLNRMAMGGIFDQAGGGFARYSTDSYWKVPHFEKMLYDNGQLLSLYAQAFQKFKEPLYRETADGIYEFLNRELLSPEYGFYSALDADSEGEEGKFYVWNEEELRNILGEDFDLFADYYNINPNGYWEHGNYVLIRLMEDEEFAAGNHLELSALKEKVRKWNSNLLQKRAERKRPGLDDKILCSWNAMALTGLVDAHKAFGDQKYLDLAVKNAAFLQQNMMTSDGTLFHSYKNGISKIDGFLEDYAWFATALLSLYEVTGDETYLNDADKLVQKSFELFFDEEKHIFYFSTDGKDGIINRSIEVHDNVIPASNSVMANLLFKLVLLTGNNQYTQVAKSMLLTVISEADTHPSGYSNWMMLALSIIDSYYEIAIIGNHAGDFFKELAATYLPNVLFCFSTTKSDIPLLKDRYKEGTTLIYVCENNSCKLPVKTTNEALALISKR